MLEHVPHWLGSLLHTVRAGHAKLTIARTGFDTGHRAIHLSSPAFSAGGRLPERFTADGAGVSPPLVWGPVPEGTQSLALLVEDPDAPAMQPLVHALAWNLSAQEHALSEGVLLRDGAGVQDERDLGLNSFLGEGWLPPDPPNGHGEHDYVFQLFALSITPDVPPGSGRAEVVEAMKDHILGAGMLVGTYSRGDPAPTAFGDPVPVPVAG